MNCDNYGLCRGDHMWGLINSVVLKGNHYGALDGLISTTSISK
jgi:hypothetical protein